jgi:adenosylhomocysteine nucleosidase
MESERRHLDALMPGWEPVEHPVWPTVRIGDVVCVISGIGMVAAAAASEHAISTYSPAMVLNFGCTGAHHRELFPGDVVIGDRLVHQGRMRFAPDGEIIPFSIGFQVQGEIEQVTVVSTDPSLRALAEEVANTISLPMWAEQNRLSGQRERPPLIRTGTVSSGDIWLQSPDLIDRAHQRTSSLCEDMEAAAIAQVCALHGVPFLTIKDISNNELLEATVFEGTTSELPSEELGMRSATVVVRVIERLREIGGLRQLRYS